MNIKRREINLRNFCWDPNYISMKKTKQIKYKMNKIVSFEYFIYY